jgi:hypothetical protein
MPYRAPLCHLHHGEPIVDACADCQAPLCEECRAFTTLAPRCGRCAILACRRGRARRLARTSLELTIALALVLGYTLLGLGDAKSPPIVLRATPTVEPGVRNLMLDRRESKPDSFTAILGWKSPLPSGTICLDEDRRFCSYLVHTCRYWRAHASELEPGARAVVQARNALPRAALPHAPRADRR